MELILSLAGLLASIAAGIVGHFIAHDLYSATPRYAKRLLTYAVKLLPEPDRKRYEEEWLAHLHECAGAIRKLRHAVECLCVARKLGQIVARRIAIEPYAIEFSFSSKGQRIAMVSMDSVTALPLLTMMDEVDNLERPIEPKRFVASKELEELFANPEVQRAKLAEFKTAVAQSQRLGQPKIEVNVTDRFGRILTTNELESWLEEHDER